LALALPARNLAIAEKYDRDLLVPCVACYNRFKVVEKEAKDHPQNLTHPYRGNINIHYALDFFCEGSIQDEMKRRQVKPLKGLKVACYYGCLTVRPPKLTSIKDYEDPQHMDRLMEMLGAQALPWSYKTDCCGASLVMTRTDVVRKLCQRLLSMALEAEADCIVTGCSMCQSNLDTRQGEIKKEGGGNYTLPILYFTELMGLALGHKDVKKWLSRHVTSPIKVLNSKGLI
jgi:heterodisulfide reductase subunit B